MDEGFVLGRLSMPQSYKSTCGATHVWFGTSFTRMQGRDVQWHNLLEIAVEFADLFC